MNAKFYLRNHNFFYVNKFNPLFPFVMAVALFMLFTGLVLFVQP